MKVKLLAVLSALLALAGGVMADGFIIVHNPPGIAPPVHPPFPPPFPPPHPPFPRPVPPPRPHYVFAPLEVVFHKVDVDIAGQKAVTRVEQEFFNPNAVNLEGEYIFPIPRGAHLDKFTMRIGDKDMEAELLDAAKARAIYEDIVRRQKDPALLEYTGRPAFRVRIFPIEPHSRKKVSVTYTELLKVDGGLATYLYPMNTEKFSAQPLKTVSMRVTLQQDAPIKALYSPSHSVDIRRDGERRAVVGWEAANTRPDTDFQLLFSTADTEVGVHLLTHKKPGEDGWFLLLASPGADVMKSKEANPKDVVFVIDTSGSMAGKKLEQAKKALGFCVENLNDTDRFEVVRFSTESEPLFEKLADATRENREKAGDFIKGLKPIGGTAIADALDRALKMKPGGAARPFVVVFLTDGKPTIGETDEERIVAQVARDQGAGTRVFCFGIGTDINTHLLDKITERTRAASQFVLPEEDLEVKVSNFFLKIKEPLLTNLKLEFPAGVRATKFYPNPMPDLFRGDQLVLAGRYSGDGDGDLLLDGTLNGQPKRMTQRGKFPAEERGNEFIAQLWALRRVGWLLDEIRLRGENKELRDEVVDLARRFAIVTPYTSYLIVEDESRRGVPLAAQTFQRLEGDAALRQRLAEGYKGLSEAKDGYAGAWNARSNSYFKNADQLAAPQEAAKREALGAVAAASAPAGMAGGAEFDVVVKQLENAEQLTRRVAGKAFAQNGNVWTDTAVQANANAKRKRVQFASQEYFDLLAGQPECAQWLALGRNVQFTLGAELYEVYE